MCALFFKKNSHIFYLKKNFRVLAPTSTFNTINNTQHTTTTKHYTIHPEDNTYYTLYALIFYKSWSDTTVIYSGYGLPPIYVKQGQESFGLLQVKHKLVQAGCLL